MLLEKSQQLIELSQERTKLQQYANNLQGFQSRQQQITEAVKQLQPYLEAWKAFVVRECISVDETLTQKLENFLSHIHIVEENFQKNSEWILENNNFKGNIFKSSVESLRKMLDKQLSEAWKNYLAQNLPITNNEMLELLAQINSFKTTVQRIKQIDSQIKQGGFPKSSQEFGIVEQQIAQLKQCWESLHSDDIPQDVLLLLKAAANQGAPLKLLTPDVQEWLTKHGIAESLRIRLT